MEDSESECLSLLELLPVEVITVIASYLTVREALQCCATSSTMRELFSDNSIWRPRCKKEIVEHLKKTPCKVAPIFVIPQMENSLLSLLPEWRISYMRENHLWNNWRNGRYIKEDILKDTNPSADFHMFYGNNCVIARYRDRVEFIDVTGFQASNLVENINFGAENSDLKIGIANNLIVFMVGSGIQVFELNLVTKKCLLKHSFLFEKPSKLTVSESQEEKCIFNAPSSEFRGKRLIVGNVFVGVLEGSPTMHIWDLETGQKIKEEVCPLEHFSVFEIQASDDNKHVVLTMRKALNDTTKIFLAYSLKKLKFLHFNIKISVYSEYTVHNNYVVIKVFKTLAVYNYQTSQAVAVFPIDSFPKTIRNNLIFIENKGIKMLNLLIPYLQLSLCLYSPTKFEVLGDKFLQIKTDDERNGDFWEISESCQFVTATETNFDFECCGFFINKACTKYIVREGCCGYLLTFW